MVPTLYLHRGTRLFVSGNFQLELQPVALWATQMTSSPFPFPQTTGKLYLARAIVQSSYGTHLETASLLSPTKGTLNGSRASASAPTLQTLSSSVLDGINW